MLCGGTHGVAATRSGDLALATAARVNDTGHIAGLADSGRAYLLSVDPVHRFADHRLAGQRVHKTGRHVGLLSISVPLTGFSLPCSDAADETSPVFDQAVENCTTHSGVEQNDIELSFMG